MHNKQTTILITITITLTIFLFACTSRVNEPNTVNKCILYPLDNNQYITSQPIEGLIISLHILFYDYQEYVNIKLYQVDNYSTGNKQQEKEIFNTTKHTCGAEFKFDMNIPIKYKYIKLYTNYKHKPQIRIWYIKL